MGVTKDALFLYLYLAMARSDSDQHRKTPQEILESAPPLLRQWIWAMNALCGSVHAGAHMPPDLRDSYIENARRAAMDRLLDCYVGGNHARLFPALHIPVGRNGSLGVLVSAEQKKDYLLRFAGENGGRIELNWWQPIKGNGIKDADRGGNGQNPCWHGQYTFFEEADGRMYRMPIQFTWILRQDTLSNKRKIIYDHTAPASGVIKISNGTQIAAGSEKLIISSCEGMSIAGIFRAEMAYCNIAQSSGGIPAQLTRLWRNEMLLHQHVSLASPSGAG